MNVMSAISSLLNMAAFLSLTLALLACQLGSIVLIPAGDVVRVKVVVEVAGLGDASGDTGAEAGCVIIASL